jgi:hypothetical protein
MTKKQKILLVIFLTMFLVPEILWSPVLNILLELGQSGNVTPLRDNFLMSSDNLIYFRIINFIQLVGIISAIILLFKIKRGGLINWFVIFVLLLLALSNFVVFYLSFALGNTGF